MFWHGDGGFESGRADFRANFVNAFLRFSARGRTRLLANHFIVVNHSRAIRLLFVIEFRDLHGIPDRFLLQMLKVFACLRHLFTLGITKQEIFESGLGFFGCGPIVGAKARRFVPDVCNLVLRIRCNRVVWKFIDHGLVGLNRGVIGMLLLPGQPNIKLGACRVSAKRGGPDYGSKDFYRALHRSHNRDSQQLYFFAGKVYFADTKLRFDRFFEIGAIRKAFHENAISVGGVNVVMALLH